MSGLEIAAVLTAVAGIAGIVIQILRYPSQKRSALVADQAKIVEGFKDLMDELEGALERCRETAKLQIEIDEARMTEAQAKFNAACIDLKTQLSAVTTRKDQLEKLVNGDKVPA